MSSMNHEKLGSEILGVLITAKISPEQLDTGTAMETTSNGNLKFVGENTGRLLSPRELFKKPGARSSNIYY